MNLQPHWPLLTLDSDENTVWLQWLVRLRWVAIFAQVITVASVFRVLHNPLVLVPIFGAVVAVLSVSNLWVLRLIHSGAPVEERTVALNLGLDVLALTLLIGLAGGTGNPFTVLLLIHVAMAAVMLSLRTALSITALVLVCFSTLQFVHLPLHLHQHSLGEERLFTLGQSVAFTVTALSVSLFIAGLAETRRRREDQLLDARERTARIDRLRSVGTMAAGAAHELNTPLGTISLRLRRVARRHDDEATQKDLTAVQSQLDRCSRVVDQLLVGAGDPSAAQMEPCRLAEVVEEGVALWSYGSGIDVELECEDPDAIVEVPRIAFTQALINLLENAREAQHVVAEQSPIEVRVSRQGAQGLVRVRDHGCGLPDETDKVGEPFFTTKETGTGLGVFVAQQVAEGSGGGLGYDTGKEPDGRSFTEASWWFPSPPRSREEAL